MEINSLAATSLVLSLSLMWLATSYTGPNKDMSVTIYNHMRAPLKVHCKSADNHLQQHTLVDRQQYGFTFKPRYWRTTLFWCDFSSGSKFLGFPVWQNAGLFRRKERWCEHCVWDVRPEGVYRGEADGELRLIHDW